MNIIAPKSFFDVVFIKILKQFFRNWQIFLLTIYLVSWLKNVQDKTIYECLEAIIGFLREFDQFLMRY